MGKFAIKKELADKIEQHIEYATQDENRPYYIQLIERARRFFILGEPVITIDRDLQYIFIPIKDPNGNHTIFDPFPHTSEFIFYLLGVMEIYDLSGNTRIDSAYTCIEGQENIGTLFWVNKKGRLPEGRRHERFYEAYKMMNPDSLTYADELDNELKDEISDLEKKYLEQMDCVKKLNIQGWDPTTHEKILSLGNEIISANQNVTFLTGTYVNMGWAELYVGTHGENIDQTHIQNASCYYQEALKIKASNQQAIILGMIVQLYLLNFQEALRLLDQVTNEFIQDKHNRFFLYEMGMHIGVSLRKNEKPEEFENEVIQILKALRKKVADRNELSLYVLHNAALLFFMIFDDPVSAYAYLREAIEATDEKEAYAPIYFLMCQICLNPQINKPSEALRYGKMANRYLNSFDSEIKAFGLSQYGVALCKNGDMDGLRKCWLAEKIMPSDITYYNYSRALFEANELEESMTWAKKALYVNEDELNMLQVADIFKAQEKYAEAIEYYEKTISLLQNNDRSKSFKKDIGNELKYIFLPKTPNQILYQAFIDIALLCQKVSDKKKAYLYIQVAKTKFPESNELRILEATMEENIATEEEINKLKAELVDVKKEAEHQRLMSKEMAIRLIQLQESSSQLDLDKIADWTFFEKEINAIIERLETEAKKNKELFNRVEMQINAGFPFLSEKEKHFLATAEALYEMHKNSEIDFACIVLEYCKVVEAELRRVMKNRIPPDIKMLGQILKLISDHGISPYNKYLSELREINKYRQNSAHTGALTQKEAEAIRRLYFNKGLLKKIK